MREPERLTRPAIVPLPAEIDISNALDVGRRLRAAVAPGVGVVIADLGRTVFCDCSGIRQLMRTHYHAVATDAELRVVVPSGTVRRVLEVLGADRVLRVYETISAALLPRPSH